MPITVLGLGGVTNNLLDQLGQVRLNSGNFIGGNSYSFKGTFAAFKYRKNPSSEGVKNINDLPFPPFLLTIHQNPRLKSYQLLVNKVFFYCIH